MSSDEKGGYLVAALPLKAVKLNMVTREITDDERDKLRERAAKAREARRK